MNEQKALQHAFATDAEYFAWLQERKTGIGGSDVSAICLANPYNTPLDVFESKTSDIKVLQNDYMMTGIILEPILSKYFSAEKQLKVFKSEPAIVTDSEYSFFKATPDYLTSDNAILEIKTTQKQVDDLPIHFHMQCNWYCHILKKKHYYILALKLPFDFNYEYFCSQTFTDKELRLLLSMCKINIEHHKADAQMIDYMIDEALRFWNEHILTGIAPEPVNADDIKRLYAVSVPDTALVASDSEYSEYLQLCELKNQVKTVTTQFENLKDSFKMLLKDKEKLIYGDKTLIEYKTSKNKTVLDEKLLLEIAPDVFVKCQTEKTGSRIFNIK